MKIIKMLWKKALLLIVACYIINVFISQQKTLNNYHAEINQYEEKITEANETKEELAKLKKDVNSNEYIEGVAREKLGMYLPNERVYIDISK